MRLDDYRTSSNVGDQRGQSFGGIGGGGGGIFGLLFGLVASRFGIGGIIVLVIGAMLFGMNPFGGGGTGTQRVASGGNNAAQACAVDQESRFSCQVLANTEDTWAGIFRERGQTYRPAQFNFYGGTGQSGCGIAQSAMGPFYCPTDNAIYLDTNFYDELRNRFGAAGDFAQAYVIAHEVGHHIQYLTGTLGEASRAQQAVSPAEGNAIQVRVELQADCYAGVWAARNRARLEPGDVEEGMTAASAIGDDTLQKQSQGRVVPESFTHGTSAQRMEWLKKGLESGDPAVCDTFQKAA
ncbi:KPN_02809 family neutral zinc metallopeptidase [Allosphingosinicella vermicomposti]|uniref:KPN_02809 family neutral zinc metallopeptidase n=1 Tax=Allosphingosinicella vermicomposti TaxID=614671 RepID=UPI000D1100B3|nr:neutral zinc metallopeptidase [Allosphingosinicella vermicomposti]